MNEMTSQITLVELLDQISNNVVLGAVLSVLSAALAAFFGAYLSKRGENRALHENFDAIREQLKLTTSDTEEIKQQLSGQAWRSQQLWSSREKYYGNLLTQLHLYRMALDDLRDYYQEPGSDHVPDHEMGDRFHKRKADSHAAFIEVQKLIGPAAIFLSPQADRALSKLITERYVLAEFDAACTAEYVSGAYDLADIAYKQILDEAKCQLGIEIGGENPEMHGRS